MGDVANTPAPAVDVFDPYFIQTLEEDATGAVRSSTIRTSRLIVLTPEKSAPVGKAVPMAQTGDLTVYGDVVRVCGTLSAPSRTIKIVCRRLEFHPGSDGTCAIVVSGEKGLEGTPQKFAATAGQDGTNLNRAGQVGVAGADGGNGGMGLTGGEIQIFCNSLSAFANVKLIAEGGTGGDGAQGQQGGAGGRGFSGFGSRAARVLDDGKSARGAWGGCGGNGGNGGCGGQGGRIKLYLMNFENPDSKFEVTLSTLGGFGGNGGQAGKGGKGGDGGSPVPGTWYQPHYDSSWGSR
jgi:hypothetical protein